MQRFENYDDLAKHKVREGGRGWIGQEAQLRTAGGAAASGNTGSAGSQRRQGCSALAQNGSSSCTRALPAACPLQVTIEEREEYEQHIKMGTVVFAGAPGHAAPCWQVAVWVQYLAPSTQLLPLSCACLHACLAFLA